MNKVLLIDADSLLWKNIEDLDTYKDRIDEIMSELVGLTEASHYKVFLEAPNTRSFRSLFHKDYKGNRVSKKPDNFREIRDYIIEVYNPYLSYLEETDDSIVSTHKYISDNYPLTSVVIATPDKDFKTKEVSIFDTYHGRYGELYDISKDEAEYNFYFQMLVGDSADNVKGCKGVGKKGAEKILDKSSNYFVSTYRAYVKAFGDVSRTEWRKNKILLTLRDDVRPCVELDKAEFDG